MSDILYRNLNPQNITQRKELTYRSQVGLCVVDAFKKRKYTRSEDSWDIFWVEKQALDSFYTNHRVSKNQRINHYRTYYEICRKDNLNRNLKKYKRQLERQGKNKQASQYNFIPMTYHLPIQYAVFLDEFKRMSTSNKNNIWIMKPTARSQGKGIFLFNKISSIQDWAENPDAENYICQKYIDNPLLIGHKKFDLRLYVLCTSYRPLNIFLYRQGFARFTHHRFQVENINNCEMHLTNVAIQKQTAQYNKTLGGKMPLSSLKLFLLSKYPSESRQSVNTCFSEISYLIIKTLKSVTKIMSNQSNCFELYGFDIMLDSSLAPWLIEINGSPSMRANTKADKELKIGVIDDLMTIIDLQGVRSGNEDIIGGFDLICKNDARYENDYYSGVPNMSMLGCKLQREKNYRLMAFNLNTYYKTNKQVLPALSPNKLTKRPSLIGEQSVSPIKKGFSVRKQKRPNSFVKAELQQKIQLPSPQQSIALLSNSSNTQSSSFNLNSPAKKPEPEGYKRSDLNIRESSTIFNKTNSSSASNQGLNTPTQEITFLPQTGKVIPKNSDKSKIFVRKISLNKN